MKSLLFKKSMYRFIGLALTLILLSCAQGGPVDVTAEIDAANEKFMAAFDANDAEKLAAIYTDDATLYPPNRKAVSGKDAIRGFWKQIFGMGIASGKLYTDEATAYGDTAIENGRMEIFIEDGTMVDQGKFMVIWKKVDGEWKMYKDMWNTSMITPEPKQEKASFTDESKKDPNATLEQKKKKDPNAKFSEK